MFVSQTALLKIRVNRQRKISLVDLFRKQNGKIWIRFFSERSVPA